MLGWGPEWVLVPITVNELSPLSSEGSEDEGLGRVPSDTSSPGTAPFHGWPGTGGVF